MSDAPERIWLQFGRRGEILPDGNHSIEPVDSVKHAYSTYFHESYVAALEAQLAEAKAALRMVDNAVYNDNGDVTYDTDTMGKAHKVARATLAKLEEKV